MQGVLVESELIEPFNKAFDQIREGIDKAVEAFEKIVNIAMDWKWGLAGGTGWAAQWWMKSNLDDIRDALNSVIERVNHAVERQLPVVSLIIASFRWLHDVYTPASELPSGITDPISDNFWRWTGVAANAYKAEVTKQVSAAKDIVEKSDFISQWLFKVGQGNLDYAVGLAKIVTGIAGDLAQAASEAVTVIDLPWALSTLAGTIGDLVTAGLDNLLDIGVRFVEALGNVRDIVAEVGDHTNFPGGKWPQTVRG